MSQQSPTDPTPEEVPPPPEWDEDLYLATSTCLVEPEVRRSPWIGIGCLLLTLGLFVVSFLPSTDLRALAYLIPVLWLHEAGHFLGMRLFGYRNVQMFFIPFFGAAVSGSKHAVPVWQQAVVLLLGPAPGILLGLILQWVYRPALLTPLGGAVTWLVIVNGLNLLPIVPLDGGRFVDALVFARRPWLAVGFRLLAVAVLVVTAWQFAAWIFGAVGLLMLIGTPARFRRARLESAFRDNPLALPDQLDELSDTQRRELFGWALLLHPLDRTPPSLASDMRALHEHMVSRPPGSLAWGLLFALYLAGLGCAVGTLWLSNHDTRAHQERVIEQQTEALIERYREKASVLRRDRNSEQHWEELIAEWKKAPPAAQQRAISRLLLEAKESKKGDQKTLLRLLRELQKVGTPEKR